MWKDDYQPDSYGKFDCPDGERAMRVVDAKDATSKKGNQMIAVSLRVDGGNGINYMHFINSGEKFDGNMTQFFDCFKIPRGDFNYMDWVGKVGRGQFYHETRKYVGNDGLDHETLECRCRLVTPPDAPPIPARRPATDGGYQRGGASPYAAQGAYAQPAPLPPDADIPF